MAKAPCYNTETKTDCPRRCAGCAVDCPDWAKYVAERDAEYQKRKDEMGLRAVINDSYSRRKTRYFKKLMAKQRWKNN